MNIRQCLGLSALTLTIVPCAWAGTEKVIPLEQVPTEHRKIAQDLFPDARFSSADIETDSDDTKIYEIKGRLPDGRRVEVDLFEDGGIEEYELEFTAIQVPGAVMNTVSRRMPGFSPTYIEASHSRSGKVTRYEMEGTLGGQHLDIEVSADGRRIEVADN
jgi:uncharacterized membrane protein YkoI